MNTLLLLLPAFMCGAQAWWKPPVAVTWHWQLDGTVNTGYDVDMYDIDLFDSDQSLIDQLHADGRVVICYFSAGSWERWRPDKSQFPAATKGRRVGGWKGEKWLDVRAMIVRDLMRARMDLAVIKGCDGVEPDNVDGYSNNNGLGLTAADQLDYNAFLATEAHARNLSIGLKNDLDQVAALEPLFDWALNEECYQYDECDVLTAFTDKNKPVFHVEYNTEVPNNAALCTAMQNAFNPQYMTNIYGWDLDDTHTHMC